MGHFILALLALAAPSPAAPAEFPPELAIPAYAQEVTVVFATEEAARRARLVPAPLYGGMDWAVSCRWDDNNRADLRMRQVMEEHGYRGTFYLTGPSDWFGGETGRELIEGGNSIGGHSMTHPYLTYVNRNRLFWEVAAVRAQWEALTDRPICSFALPFLAMRTRVEGDAVQRDIVQAIARAGYYHVPLTWFNSRLRTGFLISPLLPSDGAPIEQTAERYLADGRHRDAHPHMSFSMHVWYRTPEAWARFEGQLDAYGRRPNWWYCNQNEYAAYRRQHRDTRLAEPQVTEGELTATLERPVLRELNDAVPLTFLVEGVEWDEIEQVRCPTAQAELLPRDGGTPAFDLHHDRDRRLPEAIALIENADNHASPSLDDRSEDLGGVQGLLHYSDGTLRLNLAPGDGQALEDVHVIYRLPLAWEGGVVRRELGRVDGPGADTLGIVRERPEHKYNSATALFAAQVDFVRAGRPERLHLLCSVRENGDDPSYPQGGFLVLGPIPEERFDLGGLKGAARAGGVLDAAPEAFGADGLAWRHERPRARELLDAEVIETSGSWRNDDESRKHYVLRSFVHSPVEQPAGLMYDPESVRAAFVNGAPAEGERVVLRQGPNELILVGSLSGRQFRESNAGVFFRMVRPGTRDRLTDLRFEAGEPPAAPAGP